MFDADYRPSQAIQMIRCFSIRNIRHKPAKRLKSHGPPAEVNTMITISPAQLEPAQAISERNRKAFYAAAARLLDIAGAIVGLLVIGPLILVCALIVKISDPGPAFYTQWRVGHRGRLFRIYKLRTMYRGAERASGATFCSPTDGRVLPCGRWMRRSHIDELPQLVNILKGEMSLVGPRPERPEIFHQITRDLPGFSGRLAVRPGVTGLAQLRNGYTNDLNGHRKKLAYDLLYIRRTNPLMDLKLILGTVTKLWDRNAC